MTWLFILLVLAVVVVAVALVLRRAGRPGGDAPQARRRCVRCHGTGWVGGGPQRTLDFDGQGFADRQAPATMCTECHGTGHR